MPVIEHMNLYDLPTSNLILSLDFEESTELPMKIKNPISVEDEFNKHFVLNINVIP